MERRQRCPATSPYQIPTKTSMIPETFRVLPPLSPEIPGPPPAPKPYRVAPLTVKRRDESAFVIIADSIDRKSRDPSPASGRVSPFRGHGFKESASRHASREPSPMRQEPIDKMPPKSHLSRSRSKLPIASPGYVSGRSSTSSSPIRNQTTSIPKPVSRRGSLSPSRAVQIINQTNNYKTSTSPRHVKSKIPQKQIINNNKSPLHNSKIVQSPKRVGTIHSKTSSNANVIASKPPLPKTTQQRSKISDGRKTPQQPTSPKKQSLMSLPRNAGTNVRSPSKLPRGRTTSSQAGYNRSSRDNSPSVSPSRKGSESSKTRPRLSRSPGPIIRSRTKDNSGKPPVGQEKHKKDTDSKSATSQSHDTSNNSSTINLSGKPSVPIDRIFKREEDVFRENIEDNKTQRQVKESPMSSEKSKSSVSSKPTSSSKSSRGSPEKEKTAGASKSQNNAAENKVREGNDNKSSSHTSETKDVNSAKPRYNETREEADKRTDIRQNSDERVKESETSSTDDIKSHKGKTVEAKKGEDDEAILEPSVTLVRTTTAPALELAQPDVMPTIGSTPTPSDSYRKTEDNKQMEKDKKQEEGKETDSSTNGKEQSRLEERKKGDNYKNTEEIRKQEQYMRKEEQMKTVSVRDSAKRAKEVKPDTAETSKMSAKRTGEISDKAKTDKESAYSDVVSSKDMSVESVRSTSSVETVRAVARVKATVKKQEHDDVKGNIKEEPDVEVLSANNLLKSENNNSTRNVAWEHQSPELRQMNNSVHPVEPPVSPAHQQQLRPTQPAKPKGCCGKIVDRLKCSSCCRSTPKPTNQTTGSVGNGCCSRFTCCSETGCLRNLCRKLNCCKNCSCCKKQEGDMKQKPKRPGKSKSKFKDCISKLNCFSKCCKREGATDDGGGEDDEPQPGCCARCKKRTRRCCNVLFCLNRSCCQKLRQCTRCNRLACCKSGGCCGPDPPELNRRKSRYSLKKSQSIVQGLPKLDPTLVEHSSIMRGAIPVLPLPLAWLCLMLNVFLPGLGTLSSGIFCLCFGKPRFSINDSHATRFGAFCVNVVVAISQMFTILFCLVGWGWSIWWGVIMVRLAKKQRRILLAEKNTEQPVPVALNQNHDAERGR